MKASKYHLRKDELNNKIIFHFSIYIEYFWNLIHIISKFKNGFWRGIQV